MARMNPTARSIFAVIDGFLLFLALQAAFYAVAFLGLHQSFDTPTRLYLGANLLWTTASALCAGLLAARVARRFPLAHGVVLAIPFILLGVYNLNKGLGGRHTAFVISLNTFVPLAMILGAALAGVRRKTTTQPAGQLAGRR